MRYLQDEKSEEIEIALICVYWFAFLIPVRMALKREPGGR